MIAFAIQKYFGKICKYRRSKMLNHGDQSCQLSHYFSHLTISLLSWLHFTPCRLYTLPPPSSSQRHIFSQQYPPPRPYVELVVLLLQQAKRERNHNHTNPTDCSRMRRLVRHMFASEIIHEKSTKISQNCGNFQ